MSDIDEERLQTLMELVNKEHPDLAPYVVCSMGNMCKLFIKRTRNIWR